MINYECSDYNKYHNIIQIHNSVLVGLTVFHKIFLYVPTFTLKGEEQQRIFRGILSIPHNVVMDLDDVMNWTFINA